MYCGPGGPQRCFLHTSPEFPMKRLLAAGSGSIYQIAKVFRDGEAGRFHNPEFQLLEWYRLGFDFYQLMADVEALVRTVLDGRIALHPSERYSYRQVFEQYLHVDPHQVTRERLFAILKSLDVVLSASMADLDKDALLDLLLTRVIEPSLPRDRLVFLYHYPASQAALSKRAVDSQGAAVAQRFELYLNGVELANGFDELTDPREQRDRFEHENRVRIANGQLAVPLDERLLEALACLPECAGVALGLDRLLMLAARARQSGRYSGLSVCHCLRSFQGMSSQSPRARDLGLDFQGEPGPYNAITDVPGVGVGLTTRIEGDGPLEPGHGPVRTGVTAVIPRADQTEPQPVWAGQFSLNGNGEMTGAHWIHDGGYFIGPICLTNTHSVGVVHHAAVRWMIRRYGSVWHDHHLWALPVVGETYDGVLNDINGLHLDEADALAALEGARSGWVSEGNVGGGTGMICYEFKGGTGTASRRVTIDGERYTVGTLVQANHGIRPWFTALGVPVGRHLNDDRLVETEQGSIIVLIGTDAPMLPHQLHRVARRASLGVGRGGSPGGNNSGDIFLAFSIANPGPLPGLGAVVSQQDVLNDAQFDPFYLAVVEAVEEAVLNALIGARDMPTLRPAGKLCRALDHQQFVEVMRRYGRCQ